MRPRADGPSATAANGGGDARDGAQSAAPPRRTQRSGRAAGEGVRPGAVDDARRHLGVNLGAASGVRPEPGGLRPAARARPLLPDVREPAAQAARPRAPEDAAPPPLDPGGEDQKIPTASCSERAPIRRQCWAAMPSAASRASAWTPAEAPCHETSNECPAAQNSDPLYSSECLCAGGRGWAGRPS